MTGSIALVVVSPRVPAGLMTYDAWQRIEHADDVLGRDADEALVEAVVATGRHVVTVGQAATGEGSHDESPAGDVSSVDTTTPAGVARRLVQSATTGRDVVWLGSADADPGLTDALATELTRLDDPPAVEVVVGSWDAPGSRLLDAVAVMDTLRSPGGCPWDAKQTHASLAPYLVEEAFEVTEAIAEADGEHLREELGDVLLQVLFHARVAAERDEDGFDVDDVAAGLVDKLIRRHPHVFADGSASNPDEVEAEWARIKAAEKPERDASDPLAGIPSGLPPLERAVKVVARLAKAGQQERLDAAASEDSIGSALLDLIIQARALGVDPSVALAATLTRLVTASAPAQPGRGSETSEPATGQYPGGSLGS